jgi:AcrR family transcriptional regulator
MKAAQPDVIGQQDKFLVSLAHPIRSKAAELDICSVSIDPKSNRKIAGGDPVKRNQILDGAHSVFIRMGFDAASMSDITREAGVSKGTIYVYFKNKEDLFLALIARQRDAFFGNLRQLLEQRLPVRDTLLQYGEMLAMTMLSPDAVLAQRAIIGIAGRMPDMGVDFYNNGPRLGQRLLGEWLQTQSDAGALAIPDTDMAAIQFIELCLAGQLRPRLFGALTAEPCPVTIKNGVRLAVDVFCNAYSGSSAVLQE